MAGLLRLFSTSSCIEITASCLSDELVLHGEKKLNGNWDIIKHGHSEDDTIHGNKIFRGTLNYIKFRGYLILQLEKKYILQVFNFAIAVKIRTESVTEYQFFCC